MNKRKIRKYAAGFVALAALLSTGCGQKESQPVWPSDISVATIDGEGTEKYEMQLQTLIYGTGSHTYVENLEGERKETWEKKLSIMNLTVGDEQEEIFENCGITGEYAAFTYETLGSSGETVTSETQIYDGSSPDLTGYDCYDCMIMIAYYYDNGKWHQLNFATDDLENHEHAIAITYDVQGPEGNYGVLTGQICGLFCEYY